MATESIGVLIPTAIPGYADSADIQAAIRAYHYGSYSYSPANTSPSNLEAQSIAKYIYDIQQDIIDLENRPSSGGEVNATQPVPGDFTPPEIPDGFIWVDSDGTIGGAPSSATSIFTNSAPTSSLTTGVIWVDKDATSITNNPFIPQAIVNAKGDLIVGSADDTVTRLAAGTNGYILAANSATTSGLEWIANDQGDITAVTSGTGITVTSSTGPVPSVAIDTSIVATTSNTLTMSGKTLTSPIITGTTEIQQILEKATVSATTATGTINYDLLTNGAVTYYTSNAGGNWTLNIRGSSSTSLDSIMSTGESMTMAFLVTNGGTAYYQTGFQIDGNSVTPKWQGGTAPSSGNTNSIDIYSITIIKTGAATFTAFAAQTKFA